MRGQKGNLEKFRGKGVKKQKNFGKPPNRGLSRGPIQPTHPLTPSPFSPLPPTPLSLWFSSSNLLQRGSPLLSTLPLTLFLLSPLSFSLSLFFSLSTPRRPLSLLPTSRQGLDGSPISCRPVLHAPSRMIKREPKWWTPARWQPKRGNGST